MREALEVDAEAVGAKWDRAGRRPRMAERIGDPNDFPVRPGSSLSGHDKASNPYCVSHAVRMCLVAGVDHLHTAKSYLLDFHVLPAASLFSLVRGSLENFAAAFWILHPKPRNDRTQNTSGWHARSFREQHIALESLGMSDDAKLEAKLDAVAIPRGISTNNVRAGYRSSRAVESPSSTRQSPRHSCPGNGAPATRTVGQWAYLGMSEQEHFETTDPGVLNVKLTSDPSRVLHPTLSAFCLMVDVGNFLEQRS